MGLVDLILNLAALLLWVTWRSIGISRFTPAPGVSLVGTLKRVDAIPSGRWVYLVALLVLLALRSVLYWQLGQASAWIPTLEFPAFTVPLRSDFLARVTVYSFLSFAGVWALFYLTLLLLGLLTRSLGDQDPSARWVRSQLGWVARLPWPVQLLVPWLLGFVLWPGAAIGWSAWELMPKAVSTQHLLQQSAVTGLGTYLPWRYVAVLLLALHFVSSYVYLGKHPVWELVGASARTLTAPVRFLPLQVGRVDLRPLLAIVLVLGLGHGAAVGVARLFHMLPF